MKADTYAKLVVLEALIEAEIGYFLAHRPPSLELFREEMVARVSDLIDEVDILDSVAAGRVYDAIVDFLAELPDEDPDGVVATTLRFRRAIDRLTARGTERRDLADGSTWAIVLDELLTELADEYHLAISRDGEIQKREMLRAEALLGRARMAADRMLWTEDDGGGEILDEMDRLIYAVLYRRMRPTEVDRVIASVQRRVDRYRPSTLTRVGAFVLRQVLGRQDEAEAEANPPKPRRTGSRADRRRKV